MKKPRVEDFDPQSVPILGSPLNEMPQILRPQNAPSASKHAPQTPVVLGEGMIFSQPLPVGSSPVTKELPPETPARPNVRTNERTLERKKARHSFDVFSDQLITLREIAIQREKRVGQRVLLGDLVQEALDLFIGQERNM
jgi:hypothetical protein